MTSLHLGLDLGGTNIKAVVLEQSKTSLAPTVIFRHTTPTEAEGGPHHVSARLAQIRSEVTSSVGPVVTTGLGVPGLFDASGTIELFPNMPGAWEGFNILDAMSSGVEARPNLINDARAFALAEGSMGAGRGARVMLGIVLGTGIGGGVMINGNLHTGAHGMAGEVGHQVVVADGPRCGCGNNGCIEPLARGDVVAAKAGVSNTRELYSRAAAGDRRALDAIEEAAAYIAIGVSNAVALLGVDVVVIGGGIASAGEVVISPIREAIYRRVTLASTSQLNVVAAELGSEAGAVGAALSAL